MNSHDRDDEWFAHSDLPNIEDSKGKSRVSDFVEKTYSLNTFHFIAGLSQIFLGLTVITVCILGLVRPLWVSLTVTMVASITTMIGLYLTYITVSKSYDSNSLLRSAMKRVMKSKN